MCEYVHNCHVKEITDISNYFDIERQLVNPTANSSPLGKPDQEIHMKNGSQIARAFLNFAGLIFFIIAASYISNTLWGGKPEKIEADTHLTYSQEMSVKTFGEENNLPTEITKSVFGLSSKEDLMKTVGSFNMDEAMLTEKINKALALYAEEDSKDWQKIAAKFAGWIIFLFVVFRMTRKKQIHPGSRKVLYLASIILFGVILGADPSAMGTIKDAIALYGAKGVIFPPRMVALTVFLLMVFIANKFFCSWGCQLGTLQDLIFRFNRNKKDTKGLLPQYKPPFMLTNTIRITFLVVFTIIAFVWARDIIEFIDPFKIYKLSALTYVGWMFISILLIVSLFIYRPWCSLFCPFGLAGWFLEKISIYKIKVDYDKCVACGMCAKACPNGSMEAILKQDRAIPDCFACSTCIDTCPQEAIDFSKGKRTKPDIDKFKGLSTKNIAE